MNWTGFWTFITNTEWSNGDILSSLDSGDSLKWGHAVHRKHQGYHSEVDHLNTKLLQGLKPR